MNTVNDNLYERWQNMFIKYLVPVFVSGWESRDESLGRVRKVPCFKSNKDVKSGTNGTNWTNSTDMPLVTGYFLTLGTGAGASSTSVDVLRARWYSGAAAISSGSLGPA